jgi:hypothetical protein
MERVKEQMILFFAQLVETPPSTPEGTRRRRGRRKPGRSTAPRQNVRPSWRRKE